MKRRVMVVLDILAMHRDGGLEVVIGRYKRAAGTCAAASVDVQVGQFLPVQGRRVRRLETVVELVDDIKDVVIVPGAVVQKRWPIEVCISRRSRDCNWA